MQALINNALDALALGGYVEIHDGRDVAVAVYRAAQKATWLRNVRGHVIHDEAGTGIAYAVAADLPPCEGCGAANGGGGPTGMCYQCECEGHTDGWFNMDTGRVRTGTDEQAHLALEHEARLDAAGGRA